MTMQSDTQCNTSGDHWHPKQPFPDSTFVVIRVSSPSTSDSVAYLFASPVYPSDTAHPNSFDLGHHNRQDQQAAINGIVTSQIRYRQNQNHNSIVKITIRGAIITRTNNIFVIITIKRAIITIKRAIITNNIIVVIKTQRTIITKTKQIITAGSPLRLLFVNVFFFIFFFLLVCGVAYAPSYRRVAAENKAFDDTSRDTEEGKSAAGETALLPRSPPSCITNCNTITCFLKQQDPSEECITSGKPTELTLTIIYEAHAQCG
ncbi:hypothetical protein PG996_014135 [Apiospora saccharicola]|uniref:Uncharacterized protein n=1 Tax=Apiospora saccharicola TaxID=335842 RepID=A0ABR1TJG7_9PEZI